MPTTDDFREWLREELAHRGWSSADLARRSNLNKSHISRILRDRLPGTETLVKIAHALRLPADEVLRRAGHTTIARGTVKGQEELLSYFADMTSADRKRLIAIARTFVLERTED